MKTPPTITFPLFPQPDFNRMDEEQLLHWRRGQREAIRSNRENPGVRALYSLLERKSAALQAEGVLPHAGPHQQGQAYGVGYLCQLVRAIIEGEEASEPDEQDNTV